MLKKFYDYVCAVEAFLARSALVAMVLLIFASGVARLIRYPINWAIDLATFLFAWSCFLSADVAWRENKLMNVDLIVKIFPEKARYYIKYLNYFILTAFLIYMIVFGINLSYTTSARAFQGIPGFSYTWVTLSVPVGGVLLLITTILKVINERKKGEMKKITI